MFKSILPSVLLLTIAGCAANNDVTATPAIEPIPTPHPVETIAANTEPEETIEPISKDFPDIDDPENALFYDNMGSQAFYRNDQKSRQEDLELAYQAISIAVKLYRTDGKEEEYRRTADIKQQIVAEQKAAGYR